MLKSFIVSCFFVVSLAINPMVQAKDYSHQQTEAKTKLMAVNVNTATAKEIEKFMLGVGTMKSQAIVDFRNKNGKFKNAQALTQVKGIGKSIVEKNKNRITF